MRLLIDDDSTCSKDRACAQQPDKTAARYKYSKPVALRHAGWIKFDCRAASQCRSLRSLTGAHACQLML